MRRTVSLLVAGVLATAACSGSSDPPAADLIDDAIHVDTANVVGPLDSRLLGTNVPAWLGPQKLLDPMFQQTAVASGTTLLRFPGGSWSNSYDWLSCENGVEAGAASDGSPGCFWTWAARPSDFIELMTATSLPAMWTVSFNATAQEAAALVAFFNGEVGDSTPIGEDRRGRDWKTVGDWAQLRADHGHPEPARIDLWEVGNEIYGAKADTAAGCASFGWEDVWTCDPAAYVAGDATHDGYLAFRDAMRTVDPSIQVGAVGVADPGSWNAWGDTIIADAGGALDFYVVHHYGFEDDPAVSTVAAAPQQQWPSIMTDLRAALGARETTPIAVTEYNMIAFADGDDEALMTKAVSALYVASGIGEMANQGVAIANHWNLANGKADNGTDYGMVDVVSGAPNPSYFALALWSQAGDEVLASRVAGPLDDALDAYASRDGDGTIALVVVNASAEPVATQVDLGTDASGYSAGNDTLTASALDATDVAVNGVPATGPVDFTRPATSLGTVDGPLDTTFPAYSVTLLRFTPPAR